MVDEYVFLNGDIIPAVEARVSVFDAGFTHAAGLFETLRAYDGKVMRLKEHVRRLVDSAATLELNIDLDGAAIAQSIEQLLGANQLADARIRIVATPGSIPRPGHHPSAGMQPTVLITASSVQAYPPELYKHGMRVCICPYKQNALDPLAGHKTLAYLPRLLAMGEAAHRKCHEALWFTTDNRLAEGSICNVFIVKDNAILTPPLNTPVLPGTVRSATLELAGELKISVEEKPIDIDTLLSATEVFLTGSVLEIMPVTSIEKHQVGPGVPGKVTERLRKSYLELVAKECGLDR